MWFKNLQLYRLMPWAMTAADLEKALTTHVFQRCGSSDRESLGWLPPKNRDDRLVIELGGQWLLSLGSETKLLPSSVVNDFVRVRIAEIEDKEGYRPGKKQQREIRERVAEELLPRAFSRNTRTQVWIDPQAGWLVIDAASVRLAEDVIQYLRKSLDELPTRLIHTRTSPTTAMTEWLVSNQAPAGFSVDRDCELRSELEEKATVRYAHSPLDTEDVKNHIVTTGKTPTRLAMTFDDRISFVLTEKMEVKKLTFLDILQEQSEKAEDASSHFDMDFTLMTGELQRMLPALMSALGGEVEA